MDAVDAFHRLGQQLADREAEAAARGGGIIFGDLALAVHRIDAQPDVERRALRAQFVEQRTETRDLAGRIEDQMIRSEEHTSELQSLMRISYAVFCLKKKKKTTKTKQHN